MDRRLGEQGWLVIRVWDFEVRKDRDAVVRRIADAVRARREAARETKRVRRLP
jgi:very-short-patch-repair endonuclease